jgi:hypothetical protein
MIELKFVQRMDLQLEYYNTKDISNAINSISKFNEKEIKRNDILDYLSDVNNIIDNIYSNDLNKHILTASGIYIFADPLLSLIRNKKEEKLRDTYVSYLNNEPYNIEFPLNPYFQRADEESLIEPDENNLVEITENLLKNSISFSRSKTFNKQIVSELSNITNLLSPSEKKNTYSRSKHFAFIGYYDVCRLLFNVYVNKEHYQKMNSYLKDNFGSWFIKAPEEI